MKTHFLKKISQTITLVLALSVHYIVSAQTNVFDFTTSLGNGSFALNLNALTLLASSSNGATYTDPLDVLTFNGTNYDSLTFTVLNDFKFLPNHPNGDGFIIQAGSNGTTNPPDITILAVGNGSLIADNSVSDLFTILSSFGNFYSSGGPYPSPHIVFQYDLSSQSVSGDLLTFQLVATPEPNAAMLMILGAFCFYCWRSRSFFRATKPWQNK